MSKYFPRQDGTTVSSFQLNASKVPFKIDVTGFTVPITWTIPHDNGGFGYTLQNDGSGNLSWALPGASTDKTTPYYIPPTETYTVAINKQALYAEDIDVSGNLDVVGDLIDTRAPSSGGGGGTITGISIDNPYGLADPVNYGQENVLIGYGTYAGDIFNSPTGGVAIGANAHIGQNLGVAIGENAAAPSIQSVAIGANSNAAGGYNNTAIGLYSQVTGSAAFAMGQFAAANGLFATAIGGSSFAVGDYSIAVGQQSQSYWEDICIGHNARATQVQITPTQNIVIGADSTATLEKVVILGSNISSACPGTTVSGGFGDVAKTLQGTFYAETADATATELSVSNSAYWSKLVLPADSAYVFTTQIVGTDGTDYFSAKLDFVANIGSTNSTTVQGTPVKTTIIQTSGATTWNINAVSDFSNFRPNIYVTGSSSSTVKWAGSFTASAIKLA